MSKWYLLKKSDFETKSIHGGLDITDNFNATTTPIIQSASYAYKNAEDLQKVFDGKLPGFLYSRIANPTVNSFEKRVNLLEDGLGSIATSSGMAAISAVVMALTKSGDQIISSSSLYGGTFLLFNKILHDYGVSTKYVESTNIESYKTAINEKTKLIFLETMGNPKLDIPDIKAISDLSDDAKIPLVVDSTLTTPYLFQSKNFGVGIAIHSATKYISGNGTSIGGILVDLGNFDWSTYKDPRIQEQYKRIGEMAFLQVVRGNILQNIGSCLSPFNAFLHNLGLETLALRMEKHCSNALELAKFLNKHQKVVSVNYPGISGNQYHNIAKKQFNGNFGGLLTFQLNSKEECFKFINNLKLVIHAANLGDAKTLVIHPASTIYHESTQEEMETAGVTNNLIRVSVGIESVRDIINDFKNALEEI